jgi:thioredoxin 1
MWKNEKMKELKMKDKINCVSFTESDFEDEVIRSDQPVLAVFEAEWSGTWHIMAPVLENLCEEFLGRVKIGMVDIDSDAALAEELGISKVPSLVFFDNGVIVGHIAGLVPKHIITAKLSDMAPSTNKK